MSAPSLALAKGNGKMDRALSTDVRAQEQESIGLIVRETLFAGIPERIVKLTLAIADKYHLDALLKHIVIIEGNKNVKDEAGNWQSIKTYTPFITRDGLLHVAHQSGKLDGLSTILGTDEAGLYGETTVWRKDMRFPFKFRVYRSEVESKGRDGKPLGAWATRPQQMTMKAAELTALKRAFDVAAPVLGLDQAETEAELPEPDRPDHRKVLDPAAYEAHLALDFPQDDADVVDAEATEVAAEPQPEPPKPAHWALVEQDRKRFDAFLAGCETTLMEACAWLGVDKLDEYDDTARRACEVIAGKVKERREKARQERHPFESEDTDTDLEPPPATQESLLGSAANDPALQMPWE